MNQFEVIDNDTFMQSGAGYQNLTKQQAKDIYGDSTSSKGYSNFIQADVDRIQKQISDYHNGWATSTWFERGLRVNESGLNDWRKAYICRVEQGNSKSKCVGIPHRSSSRSIIRHWYNLYNGNVNKLRAMLATQDVLLQKAVAGVIVTEQLKQEQAETEKKVQESVEQEQKAGVERGKRTMMNIGIGIVILAVVGGGIYYGRKLFKK